MGPRYQGPDPEDIFDHHEAEEHEGDPYSCPQCHQWQDDLAEAFWDREIEDADYYRTYGMNTTAELKCRQCGKPMNPVDAMVGGAGDGKDPICQACTVKNHKQVAGAKTAAVTPGFYIVGPNSSPIEGPFETVSDAVARIPKTRGAAVEWLAPPEDANWEALKAQPFPFGLNTVNGSRTAAVDVSHIPPEWIQHAADRATYSGTDTEWGLANRANPNAWVTEWQLIAPEYVLHGENIVDEKGNVRQASKTAADTTASPLRCMECDKRFKRKVGPGSSPKCPSCGGYDVEPDYERGFPLHGSKTAGDSDRVKGTNNDSFWESAGYGLTDAEREEQYQRANDEDDGIDWPYEKEGSWQDRYATARRVASLRHFQ
jgi:Zn finger protein HypA/HybF involved in hydrogenase expression